MINRKILIIEDEQIIGENLRFILNEYGYGNVDLAMDDTEAVELFDKTDFDLVLSDINLGPHSNMDGIDLIQHLAKKHSFVYIYITANGDQKTVNKAKDTKPEAFIIKPFVKASIFANVEIALNNLKKDVFFSYSNKGMQEQINLNKITYIEADGGYISIFTLSKNQIFIRKAISEFEKEYNEFFVRIHKSILVNINKIQAYNSISVSVNDVKLTLGRSYKDSFLEKIEGLTFIN